MGERKTTVRVSSENLDSDYRKEKAITAAASLQKIINHPKFKELIMAMPESHRRTEISQYKHAPNEEIYRMIMLGKEEWNDDVDYEIDLVVDDYTSSWFRRGVIGYMIPGQPKIWVNTRHFDTASVKAVVSNFLHEYGHTLGFRHSSADPDGSIPYYLNKVVEQMWGVIYPHEAVETDPEKPRGYWSCKRVWYTLWIKRRCWWVSLE